MFENNNFKVAQIKDKTNLHHKTTIVKFMTNDLTIKENPIL